MYLMLFEDGEIKSAEDVSDDDLRAVDDGVMEVVDISEPFTPQRYIGGAWHEIEGIDA